MADMKRIPFYRRFGYLLFLLLALLLYSMFYSLWTVEKGDYKVYSDRMVAHRKLFDYTADQLSWTDWDEWPDRLASAPFLFPGQRWILFYGEESRIFGNGEEERKIGEGRFSLFLPHPYAPEIAEDGLLLDFLLSLPRPEGDDFPRLRSTIRTMETEAGSNRIIALARNVYPSGGDRAVLVLASDATDILMQRRGVKERFLFVSLYVLALGLALSLALTKSVISPVRKLHRYAREIHENPGSRPPPPRLSDRWEISEICRTLQGLIEEQMRRTERFRRFSSDTVHELKTPLTAIRSALELLEDSRKGGERERLFSLLYRRIAGMEELMEGIYRLGEAETAPEGERTERLIPILEDLRNDFSRFKPIFRIPGDCAGMVLPLSEVHLRLILENLLTNGTAFSPWPGTVRLALIREGKKVRISVTDEGPGIEEEHLGRLTERFYSGRREKEGHMGLGLSLAEAALDSCGGSLAYGNRPEGGAFFTVRIPLSPHPGGERPGRKSPTPEY